ncbi:MAG: hypothetical protein JNN30_04795 [Rhodanobacteraceae bacterium]|nr:hypothetical protein [Rhodanobacteraceae bacterium]
MSDPTLRERVHRARVDAEHADRQLINCWQSWHKRFDRHRLAFLIGGGLLGGLTLAMVSPKHVSRVRAFLFGGKASLVRSPIIASLLAMLWTALLDTSSNTDCHAEGARPSSSGDER